jgi:long-subunit fatty acid transport protein
VITYLLGVVRRINDDLSVFGRVTYEESNGAEASRLSPTDGSTSIGIGGSYTMNGVKFTGGIEYAMLGDATDASGVEFKDNSAIGLGLSIGYSF